MRFGRRETRGRSEPSPQKYNSAFIVYSQITSSASNIEFGCIYLYISHICFGIFIPLYILYTLSINTELALKQCYRLQIKNLETLFWIKMLFMFCIH